MWQEGMWRRGHKNDDNNGKKERAPTNTFSQIINCLAKPSHHRLKFSEYYILNVCTDKHIFQDAYILFFLPAEYAILAARTHIPQKPASYANIITAKFFMWLTAQGLIPHHVTRSREKDVRMCIFQEFSLAHWGQNFFLLRWHWASGFSSKLFELESLVEIIKFQYLM